MGNFVGGVVQRIHFPFIHACSQKKTLQRVLRFSLASLIPFDVADHSELAGVPLFS